MFVAFMLKHTILVECRATLFEVEFKFHLNFGLELKTRNGKGFIFEKLSSTSFLA